MNTSKTISIFGATGSIGDCAADVIGAHKDRFDVIGVTAYRNVEKLAARAIALGARRAVIADDGQYDALKTALSGHDIVCAAGESALLELASESVDVSLMAIMGFAGLTPIMRAIEQGGCVAIANKEPLVAAGAFVMAAAVKHNATVLPIDSEHNAIFQVFDQSNKDAVSRLILTASGGPFRGYSKEQLGAVTLDQALKHPNWEMGAKITIDSATMSNKALEVIEAHYLFNMPADQIDVIIHPQSVVHSMVEYCDGSVLAQMGASDMRTPISHVLDYPQRLKTTGARLGFAAMSRLEFETPDLDAFPTLGYAYEALKAGSYAQIALNAANEVAVNYFLDNKCAFLDIMNCQHHVLNAITKQDISSLDDVSAYDEYIRQMSQSFLKQEAA